MSLDQPVVKPIDGINRAILLTVRATLSGSTEPSDADNEQIIAKLNTCMKECILAMDITSSNSKRKLNELSENIAAAYHEHGFDTETGYTLDAVKALGISFRNQDPVVTTTTTDDSGTTPSVTTTTTVNIPAERTKRGDVNCDNAVDVSDAVLLARFLAEDSEVRIPETGLLNADCNDSNSPDQDDLILILKVIAFIIRFPD
ncbi:MAG TPA: hypothetical protein DCG49_12625 [Ruminococcus sp.]|nr:hypothetical protein [Ruminococcus sp.]